MNISYLRSNWKIGVNFTLSVFAFFRNINGLLLLATTCNKNYIEQQNFGVIWVLHNFVCSHFGRCVLFAQTTTRSFIINSGILCEKISVKLRSKMIKLLLKLLLKMSYIVIISDFMNIKLKSYYHCKIWIPNVTLQWVSILLEWF